MAWSGGNNGGGTAKGVTEDTILVSYRVLGEKGFQQTLAELAGASLSDTPQTIQNTISAFAVALNSYVLNRDIFSSIIPGDVVRPVLWERWDLERGYPMYALCLSFLLLPVLAARSVVAPGPDGSSSPPATTSGRPTRRPCPPPASSWRRSSWPAPSPASPVPSTSPSSTA